MSETAIATENGGATEQEKKTKKKNQTNERRDMIRKPQQGT
jgi:hypothetical protein